MAKEKKKIYVGYYTRMFILGLMFIGLLFVVVCLSNKTIKYTMDRKATYIEKGTVDYTVNLKDNNFYDSNLITNNDNSALVSSLIDKINLTYSYYFDSTKDVNGDFTYKVIGELKVKDKETNSEYFTKTYELTSEEVENIKEKHNLNIIKNIIIDYDYYNNLAENFKNTYGVDTNSELDVYLQVENTLSPIGSSKETTNVSKTLVKIPLSDKAMSISIEKEPLNKTNVLIKKSRVEVTNIFLLFLATAVIVIAIIVYSKMDGMFEKTLDHTNLYDEERERILDKYDKLIVNVNILPDLNEYEEVKITEFKELLDVRRNYKEPIRYMEVTPHTKCHFFVKHDKEVFIYTLKNVDLENSQDE